VVTGIPRDSSVRVCVRVRGNSPILLALSPSPIPAERLPSSLRYAVACQRDMRLSECDYERRGGPTRTLTPTRTPLSLHSSARCPTENTPLIPETPLFVRLSLIRFLIRDRHPLVPLLQHESTESGRFINARFVYSCGQTFKRRKIFHPCFTSRRTDEI